MTSSDRTTMHGSLVQGIKMTVPMDFLQELVASTCKKYWTAEVKRSSGADGADEESGTSGSLERSDVTVTTDVICGQKTYFCATFTGIQLRVNDGRLELNILDMRSTPGQCKPKQLSQYSKTSTKQCAVQHLPADSPVNSQTPHLSDQHSTTPASGKFSDDESAKILTASSSEVGAKTSAQNHAVFEQAGSPLTTSAVNDRDNNSKDGKTEKDSTEATLEVNTVVQTATTQATEVEKVENPQSETVVKRKRGRPRKSTKNTPTAVNSTAPLRSQVSNPVNAEQQQTTSSRYCLRGKKLPAAIFGDSCSELEEDGDDEYHPPSIRSLQLNSSSSALDAKLPKNEDEHLSLLRKGQNGKYKEEPDAGKILVPHKAALKNGTPTHSQKSIKENHSESGKSISANQNRKHKSPTRPAGCDATHPPLKKKRMKIDVTGLPSYSRRRRNNERNATCKYCERKFCDFTGVLVHVRKFHSDMKDVEQYQQELKTQAVVKCSLCSKEFDNRFQLYLHEDKVHFKAGELPCGHCGKKFSNMVLVKQHIRSVHQVKGQQHTCNICNARFKWAATLKSHVAEVHQGIRNVACDVCGKTFYRQAQLNRHAIIHGPEDTKLPCTLCERKFSYAVNLQRHMSIVHGPQEEAWHCAYCGKGFQRKESLHNHVEKVHFSIFPYHCPECKAGFLRAVLLEKHLASEHNIFNFEVPPARRAHFKFNRSELDDLMCGICEEKFCYKSHLVQHIFTVHSDTFPFHCNVCQQVFTQKQFLVLHCKKAHAIQPDPEDMELNMEDGSSGQEANVVSGLLNDGLLHKKKPLLPSSKQRAKTRKEERDTEKDSYPASSFVIKVENGNNTIQYVIQNPEGDGSVPSESVVQDIANFLLASSQTSQDGGAPHNILLHPVSDTAQQSAEASQVIIAQTLSDTDSQCQGEGLVQEGMLEGGDPSHVLSFPQNIIQLQQEASVKSETASDNPGLVTIDKVPSVSLVHHPAPGTECCISSVADADKTTHCSPDVMQVVTCTSSSIECHSGQPQVQPESLIAFEMVTHSDVSMETTNPHIAMDPVQGHTHDAVAMETDGQSENALEIVHPQITMDTTHTHGETSMERAQCHEVGQQVVGYIPEHVVLEASDMLGSAELNQHIIITTRTVDGECVILSADVQQE